MKNQTYYPLAGRLWIVSLAGQLCGRANRLIAKWPQQDRDGLGDQWKRAIDSIGLNVSEGYARVHTKERLHFFSYASGSVEEALFCIRSGREKGLIHWQDGWVFCALLVKLGKAITNLAQAETNNPTQ